ncbi:hypothetical protein JTB14_021948 [Gonioctena quinquepunctata]|nr:hypothetical protein JTB14_021948 [Gonioctena quinquepunctata]
MKPICLLNSISKIYEGLLRERLERDLEEKGKSIGKPILILQGQNPLTSNMVSTRSIGSKMLKLESNGIHNYLLTINNNYLKDRSLQIDKDDDLEVTSGVPQGSIQDPLCGTYYMTQCYMKKYGRSDQDCYQTISQ